MTKANWTTPRGPQGRIPLRSILGVALLIGCFVLALQMRAQERAERAPKQERVTGEVAAKESVVSDPSDVSVVRIARRGQAALTFMLDEGEVWQLDGVEHTMDQARVRAIIEQVVARCVRGDALTEEEISSAPVMAELLVEDWRVTLRFEEGEGLGERIYWLERQGMRCTGREPARFDEQTARTIVPVSVSDVMARGLAGSEGGGQRTTGTP